MQNWLNGAHDMVEKENRWSLLGGGTQSKKIAEQAIRLIKNCPAAVTLVRKADYQIPGPLFGPSIRLDFAAPTTTNQAIKKGSRALAGKRRR